MLIDSLEMGADCIGRAVLGGGQYQIWAFVSHVVQSRVDLEPLEYLGKYALVKQYLLGACHQHRAMEGGLALSVGRASALWSRKRLW